VKSRAFWMMQIGGWLAFLVALVVPWLGAFPLPRMLWNKLPLIVTGFAVTLALRFAYRRFLQRGAPIWLLAVAGVAASWIGSLLYFGIALYRSTVRAQALAHEARLEALRTCADADGGLRDCARRAGDPGLRGGGGGLPAQAHRRRAVWPGAGSGPQSPERAR